MQKSQFVVMKADLSNPNYGIIPVDFKKLDNQTLYSNPVKSA